MEKIESLSQYEAVISRETPVVLVFSADWCPDCRFLDTFIDQVVEEYQDKFAFYHVDRDEQSELCEKLDVLGIPSFIAYQAGEEVNRFVNGKRKSRQEVTEFLNQTLVAQTSEK